MQLRPEIELIEVSGRSLRIVDAHLITAGSPPRPIGHDLPDRGVELTVGPEGYTARWSRNSVSLPGIARAFVGGAAGGALFRLLGLPGAVLGAVIAVGLARSARDRPTTVPDTVGSGTVVGRSRRRAPIWCCAPPTCHPSSSP